ncbi:hypothetical protein Calow_1408 [Caldicellulosiruptor owensensis OL]|uniref:Uncharacterized protein n=1 Tax=Caldicellulosiruptor owensensis (strain ATCC 700167 / DSM 13100 / OL) TaxID=632518 RepID=E4Q2T9_CALOW|nr:hypothetical protein [Caldicellulosiruptor owensensis]ADQ04957.1 hypothetical protein Calow_1408 [Caldicellulosiruptor owensensis OL]
MYIIKAKTSQDSDEVKKYLSYKNFLVAEDDILPFIYEMVRE